MGKQIGENRAPRAALWIRSTAALLIPLWCASMPVAPLAFAIASSTNDPNAINTSSLQQATVNCDDFCGNLVKAGAGNNGSSFANAPSAKDASITSQSNIDQNSINTTGGTSWSSTDDQWCSNHGQTTDPSVMATATPAPVSTSASGAANSCNVPLLAGDPTGAAGCKAVSQGLMRCMLRNSQVIPACLAYEAADDATGPEKAMLALDAIGAAVCTTACILDLASDSDGKPDADKTANSDQKPSEEEVKQNEQAVQKMDSQFDSAKAANNNFQLGTQSPQVGAPAPQGMGFSPGTTTLSPGSIQMHFSVPRDSHDPITPEYMKPLKSKGKVQDAQYEVLRQKKVMAARSSFAHKFGMFPEMFLALYAAGVISKKSDAGMFDAACKVAGMAIGTAEVVFTILQATQGQNQIANTLGGVLGAAGVINSAVGVFKDGVGQAKDNLTKNDKKGSCIAAAIFAVTTGVRAWSLSQDAGVKGKACDNVQSLASSAMSTSGTATAGGSGTGSSNFNAMTGAGGYGAAGSGGGSGTVTSGATTTAGNASGSLACVGNTGSTSGCTGTSSAATDSGMLDSSGLGKALAPIAAQNAAGLANLAATQGAGAALGSAMGGGAGDMGAAISKLAQDAQNDAPHLLGTLGMGGGGGYAGGGGGGSKSSGGGDSSNPFANLFGGGAKDAGARAPASEQFGKQHVMDIWHTGTTDNIFQIISGKVSQVVNRVMSK